MEKGHVGTEGRFQLIPCDKFMNLISKAKAWHDTDISISASWIHHTQPETGKLSFKTRIERNEATVDAKTAMVVLKKRFGIKVNFVNSNSLW